MSAQATARFKRIALLAAAVLAVGIVIVDLVGAGESEGPPRAVIVDQLSLTAPNPKFGEEASAMLERAGYEVDYFPGEEVTVEFYRDLPKGDYDLVLLRAHAGRYMNADGTLGDDVTIFTSETYDWRAHGEEQLEGQLKLAVPAGYEVTEENTYFGLAPEFVTDRMSGGFDGATVVLMGCDVLRGERMADAFVQRGAETVVGWDDSVSARHTDAATLNMLEHHLFGGLSPATAAVETMEEVGPDPFYESELVSYPSSQGEQHSRSEDGSDDS